MNTKKKNKKYGKMSIIMKIKTYYYYFIIDEIIKILYIIIERLLEYY